MFLQVLDEIQTGNLAIDGAKNFGRFEAFFLPAAQWKQVRDAFWARTGFPVDPGAAVERLKERLSDAFDCFLEGVADNRQVAVDDDGWRLKTDPAEPPDPAQSDRLAELHRWLDAPQPHDPARRPAHRGRERPQVQPSSVPVCFGIRIAFNGGPSQSLARPSRPSGSGSAAATALEVVSPAGQSTRTVKRQVTCYWFDLPRGDDITSAVRARRRRRQTHVDRKARQAARALSRSRLPPRGMHRRKMSADQPLAAH